MHSALAVRAKKEVYRPSPQPNSRDVRGSRSRASALPSPKSKFKPYVCTWLQTVHEPPLRKAVADDAAVLAREALVHAGGSIHGVAVRPQSLLEAQCEASQELNCQRYLLSRTLTRLIGPFHRSL